MPLRRRPGRDRTDGLRGDGPHRLRCHGAYGLGGDGSKGLLRHSADGLWCHGTDNLLGLGHGAIGDGGRLLCLGIGRWLLDAIRCRRRRLLRWADRLLLGTVDGLLHLLLGSIGGGAKLTVGLLLLL